MRSKAENPYLSPWHLDCRMSAQLPSDNLVTGRFLLNLFTTSLASGVFIFTCWQLYVSNGLSSEIAYWQEQITGHKLQFSELKLATRQLETKVARIDETYKLMGPPYVVSDLVINIGRTRLPKMNFVSINGFANGVVLHGLMHETAGPAAKTLRHYIEELRKDPAIGPLFATIALISLDRDENADALTFEIACKLKVAPPP